MNLSMINQRKILNSNGLNNQIAIERLTALWALNECALGGIMHAFKIPFTGILVGGISVLLITLIAICTTKIWSTLVKALIIVLLVKVAISPYTPITAYFAVSFQAFLGMLIYSIFSIKNSTILVLTVITFLESALQKLFTLTIVFGSELWKAIDIYLEWIGNQFSFLPFTLNSSSLIYSFLGTYFISGIIVGILIIRTIKLIGLVNVSSINIELLKPSPELNSKKIKSKRLYLFLILLGFLLIPIIYKNNDNMMWQNSVYLVIRSVSILIIWYALLGPLLVHFLNKFLSTKRAIYYNDMNDILLILPTLKRIIYHSWIESKEFRGFNKLSQFLAKSIAYSLYFENNKK